MASNDLGKKYGIPDDVLDGIFAESEIQNRDAINTLYHEDTKTDDTKPDQPNKNVCQKEEETKTRTADGTIGEATGTEEKRNSKQRLDKQ